MGNMKKIITSLFLMVVCMNAKAQYEPMNYLIQDEPLHHELRLGGGYGFVTSRIYYYDHSDTWKGVANYSADYLYHSNAGYIFGVNAMRSHINYSDPINIDHIGACFGFGAVTSKWKLQTLVGIGYSHTNLDEKGLKNGIGFLWSAGADYVVSRHFGIGLELREYKSIYSGQTDLYGTSGFNTLGLTAGLRYYF